MVHNVQCGAALFTAVRIIAPFWGDVKVGTLFAFILYKAKSHFKQKLYHDDNDKSGRVTYVRRTRYDAAE
jgi:hypothetical protein